MRKKHNVGGCCCDNECTLTDITPGLRWIDWTGGLENNAFYGTGDGWTYGGGWSHNAGTATIGLQSASTATLSRTIALQASGTTTLLIRLRRDAATPANGSLQIFVGGVLRLTQSTATLTTSSDGQTLNVTSTLTGNQTVELRLTGNISNSASSAITVFSVTRFGSGVVPASTTVTRTISKPAGNWTVDIQTTARGSTSLSTITVGSIIASVNSGALSVTLGSCSTLSQTGSYWIRFQETTLTVSGNEKRRRRIAAFTSNPVPPPGDSPPTAIWSECQDFAVEEGYDPPDTVTITILGASGGITIGTVQHSDTEQDNSNCPPVPCTMAACVEGSTSGGPKLFMATNVRLQVSGFELMWLKYRYQGMMFPPTGDPVGPIDIWEKLEWDLGVLNGTYAYQLFDGSTPLNPTQTQAVIDSIKEVGICPSQNDRYTWRSVITVDISGTDTYSRGPNSSGSMGPPTFNTWNTNFPTAFNQYTSSTIAAWFNNAWQFGGAPATVQYNPGTRAYPTMWRRTYRVNETSFINSLVRETAGAGIMTNAIRASQSGEGGVNPTIVVGNAPTVNIPLLHCSQRSYADYCVHDINMANTYTTNPPGTHTLTFESNVTTMQRAMLIDYVEI